MKSNTVIAFVTTITQWCSVHLTNAPVVIDGETTMTGLTALCGMAGH